ncbi:PE domain-containing protein [Pseudonocardia sp. C8]|uniref:PE domain-containing protein n=1 Tax=Pseudonocardia sp. C8 TaxID=2762759 RepID=UPI0016433C65|nr:PE domain-containing protein [Pseudonocardia sp. C8]MBC3193011.1 PE domain-containing protein [Pseudonocardia sp. C8]
MSPEQQRSIADLVAQVDADNVLQVAARLQQHANEIQDALNAATPSLTLQPCGRDPVSRRAPSWSSPGRLVAGPGTERRRFPHDRMSSTSPPSIRVRHSRQGSGPI